MGPSHSPEQQIQNHFPQRQDGNVQQAVPAQQQQQESGHRNQLYHGHMHMPDHMLPKVRLKKFQVF